MDALFGSRNRGRTGEGREGVARLFGKIIQFRVPARYHFFARALEGAFICLNQTAHQREGQQALPSLFLRRFKRCVSCAILSKGGVVYRFLTGQDAPVSVLAEALYQHIPPSKDRKERQFPGQGRKLLNFTDSRQNTAFFAPYLERSHNRNLRRLLIFKTLAETPGATSGYLRSDDLLHRLVKLADDEHIFSKQGDPKKTIDANEWKAAIWLMQEFTPLNRRLSLEGLGLLRIRPVRSKNIVYPTELKAEPWGLNEEAIYDLIVALLNTLRWQGAVEIRRGKGIVDH